MRGLFSILILALLLCVQPNPRTVMTAPTRYYSTESELYHGTEITNHTLSHASDDAWYQVISEVQDLFHVLSVVLVFSTGHYPSTLTQLSIFIEAHIQVEADPNVVVRIYNFKTGHWLDLFFITDEKDTVHTWSILEEAPNFMNTTGHVQINFFYYNIYPQHLFQDLTYITIVATKPKASFFYTRALFLLIKQYFLTLPLAMT